MVVALDEGGIKWLHRYAHKNYWKVRHIYDDVEDLIQDGHLCWGIVANKYTDVGDLTQDGRLMSLFKMTFSNHIIWTASRDKSHKDYRLLKESLDALVAGQHFQRAQDNISVSLSRSGHYLSMEIDPAVCQAIVEAIEPVRSVLKFLVSETGSDIMRRPFRRRLDGTRETPNSRIRRYIRGGEGIDLLGVTKQYLQSAS